MYLIVYLVFMFVCVWCDGVYVEGVFVVDGLCGFFFGEGVY